MNNFDRLAHLYRWMEYLSLGACLAPWIVNSLYRCFGLLTGLRVRKLPDTRP